MGALSIAGTKSALDVLHSMLLFLTIMSCAVMLCLLWRAQEAVAEATSSGRIKGSSSSTLGNVFEVASLIFLAEWGDRSMLATIALGAAQVRVGWAVPWRKSVSCRWFQAGPGARLCSGQGHVWS